MSGRLKFLLAILAVGAGMSLWYSTGNLTASLENTVVSPPSQLSGADASACIDTDSDGLCDYDETYWNTDFKNPDTDGDGFKDGEEVLTGHDPVKAGPDDLLNDRRNLTQRASALLLGGIATGDLDTGSPKYQASIDRLVQDIFDQYDKNVATDTDSLVTNQGSLDDLVTYGTTMSRTMQPMFLEINANFISFLGTASVSLADLPSIEKKYPGQFKAFAAAADAEVTAFSSRISAIKAIKVPVQMESFHRSMLAYLHGMQQRYAAVKNISHDPLMGIISLQVLSTLADTTPVILASSLNHQLLTVIDSK